MSIFKAYDIRGIYEKELTDAIVYRIGFFIPKLLKTDKVLVGRDMRVSSPALFTALCQGITDAGASVYNAGLCTTPMIYWGTAKFGFEASVMITASHNPGKYNGLKITRSEAMPVGFDSGLDLLEQMVANEEIVINRQPGTLIPSSKQLQDHYFPFLNTLKVDIGNLKIGVDCSNGSSGYFVRQVLGEDPIYINDLPDGTFPNHEPNPLEPENIVQLQELVTSEKLDVGVIFDGDADRVMFTDEKGRFISPDLLIAAMGHYYGSGDNRLVLHDIRSSRAVSEYLEQLGYQTRMWRVGRAYAATKLREINGLYGGELAGHYYFSQFYFSDSGFLAAKILLEVFARFKEQKISVGMLIDRIKGQWANTGEINWRITRKQEAMDAVRDFFLQEETPQSNHDFDGYRVDFPKWWFNIRPSNTEPYLRFIAEAENWNLLDEKMAKTQRIIEQFLDR